VNDVKVQALSVLSRQSKKERNNVLNSDHSDLANHSVPDVVEEVQPSKMFKRSKTI
jgi:hypothetical protein